MLPSTNFRRLGGQPHLLRADRSGFANQPPQVPLVSHPGFPRSALRQRGDATHRVDASRCQGRGVHGQADGGQPIRDAADVCGGLRPPAHLCQPSRRDLSHRQKRLKNSKWWKNRFTHEGDNCQRKPEQRLLQPFCAVCGALGLGAGPCWRPRPSPAAPGPRSIAAPAAEGSHSGRAGESQEDSLAATAPILSPRSGFYVYIIWMISVYSVFWGLAILL